MGADCKRHIPTTTNSSNIDYVISAVSDVILNEGRKEETLREETDEVPGLVAPETIELIEPFARVDIHSPRDRTK